jgi:hypothetical protein
MRKFLDHFVENRLWPDLNWADQERETRINTEK